jgi:hypothetical protein
LNSKWIQLSKSLALFLPSSCYISYHIAHPHQTPVLSSPRRSLKHRASTSPTKVGLAQKVLELVKKCHSGCIWFPEKYGVRKGRIGTMRYHSGCIWFPEKYGMRKGRIGTMRYHFIIYLDVRRKQEINATSMPFLTDSSNNNFSFYFFPFP